MAESFETLHSQGVLSDELTLRMKKAVGFRNIAVHAYQEINWEITTVRLNRQSVPISYCLVTG